MRIHREGYPTLLGAALALATLNAVLHRLTGRFSPLAAALSGGTFLFLAQFFRSPRRRTPANEGCVVAPADGTIVAIEHMHEGEFFHDDRLKISIYMSVVNVHLNRVPVTGQVIYYRYHPGQYLVAFHPKSSELNERTTIVFETPGGARLLTRQIAGILARRITCYLHVGQSVQAGQELGFIKFGSRCDVFLPPDCRPDVALEQKVKGGETILAWLDSMHYNALS